MTSYDEAYAEGYEEGAEEKAEEIKQLKTQIDELKEKNEAVSKVNMFLSIQWKELKTNQNLAEMSGLGMDIGTDIAIVNIAHEFVKLKEENEKLKQEIQVKQPRKAQIKKLFDEDLSKCREIRELKEKVKELKEKVKELEKKNKTSRDYYLE